MMIGISRDQFHKLTPGTQAELMKVWGQSVKPVSFGPSKAGAYGPEYDGIDMNDDVYDLTPKQIQKWMENASDKTKAGLRVIAEFGPVITASQLTDAGVENLPHFQSRTTIRTRTVTGEPDAYLLGWDDWSEVDEGEGRYAVTPITHQALRQYFNMA